MPPTCARRRRPARPKCACRCAPTSWPRSTIWPGAAGADAAPARAQARRAARARARAAVGRSDPRRCRASGSTRRSRRAFAHARWCRRSRSPRLAVAPPRPPIAARAGGGQRERQLGLGSAWRAPAVRDERPAKRGGRPGAISCARRGASGGGARSASRRGAAAGASTLLEGRRAGTHDANSAACAAAFAAAPRPRRSRISPGHSAPRTRSAIATCWRAASLWCAMATARRCAAPARWRRAQSSFDLEFADGHVGAHRRRTRRRACGPARQGARAQGRAGLAVLTGKIGRLIPASRTAKSRRSANRSKCRRRADSRLS